MAKLVYGPIVSDARKKIAGSVFTKVRSGAIARKKVSPIQPRTSTQMNVRANFTALAKAWSGATMDDTKRAAWNALAQQYPQKDKFGASHILTGLQFFVRLNRNRNSIGLGNLYDAPSTLSVGYPGALTVTATAPGTLSIVPATDVAGTESWVGYAAAQQSPGRTFVGARYRLLAYGGGSSPYDLSSAYTAKFGALVAGKKVAVRLVYVTNASGAKSIASESLKVVT
jgi:hypothetical protein